MRGKPVRRGRENEDGAGVVSTVCCCRARRLRAVLRMCQEQRRVVVLPAFETGRQVGLAEGQALVKDLVARECALLGQGDCCPREEGFRCPVGCSGAGHLCTKVGTGEHLRSGCAPVHAAPSASLRAGGDKAGVLSEVRRGRLIPFAQLAYPRGHNATDFERWYALDTATTAEGAATPTAGQPEVRACARRAHHRPACLLHAAWRATAPAHTPPPTARPAALTRLPSS